MHWEYEESGNLEGTEWSFERFPVSHTPETDPHGYRLVHNSGLSILHCGDSGPCNEIEERASDSQIVILEMGVPDFVNSPHHHNPSDVLKFSERHPHARLLVTHNFSKSPGFEQGFKIPELPSEIIQLNDGDSISVHSDGEFDVNN